MYIYFAGAESNKHMESAYRAGARNFLYSFFYLKRGHTQSLRELKERESNINIFLDSGGYSARKSGVEVDIYAYLLFLRKNKDLLTVAVNLDVMDLEQSDRNQELLETEFPVLPVYHAQEFVEGKEQLFLDMCQKYKYICLGGVAGANGQEKVLTNFFNFCFKNALPDKVKIHGLGITDCEYLKQYPFYSSDSTTWLQGGRFGVMQKWDSQKYRMQSTLHYGDRKKMLDNNIDIKAIKTSGSYLPRLENDVKEILKMEADITKLWISRGVDFSTW